MITSEMKEDINMFLKNYGIWIAVGVLILIALTIVLIFVFKKKNKTLKDNNYINVESDEWLIAFGSKENILDASAVGSRLSVKLNNESLLDQEALKKLGASSIIKMSDKYIIVIENKAQQILEIIQK